jgi:hypothetical protein
MLLGAPWLTRAVTSADTWLIRGLLRRLERNLHDGAQIRLATLAMNLGMAREKLGDGADVADAAAVRELVDAALRGDAMGSRSRPVAASTALVLCFLVGVGRAAQRAGMPSLSGHAAHRRRPTTSTCDITDITR